MPFLSHIHKGAGYKTIKIFELFELYIIIVNVEIVLQFFFFNKFTEDFERCYLTLTERLLLPLSYSVNLYIHHIGMIELTKKVIQK